MKNLVLFAALFLFAVLNSFSSNDNNHQTIVNNSVLAPNNIFLQSGNINTVFRTDGIFNYDRVSMPFSRAGLVWPVSAPQRLTAGFTAGIWVGAKVNIAANQKELRLAASFFNSHFTAGNIPVNGQVPPQSVCNDSAFKGYLVNLTDPSLVNGGIRTKNAGGSTYNFNYSPWSAWPINLGAPYVEVNGVPGYQPGWNADRPGTGVNNSRPSEMIFMVFMDYTNCTNDPHLTELSLPGGSLPLGVEIQQLAYAYETPGMLNTYFVSYKIINKSGKNWDSTYFSLVNDADVGFASDDAVGCDSSKNIAYTYNFDNDDSDYGTAPPALGYKIIQGPVKNTGMSSDTAKFPCYNKVGYKMLKMTGHNRFVNTGTPCTGDPDHYVNAYNYMQGKDGCGAVINNPLTGNPTKFVYSGNGCQHTGWYDSTQGDKRNLINSGPFNMAAGDTQFVVYAYAIERGSDNYQSICTMMNTLDFADQFYLNCSGTIGIEPIGNSVPQIFSLEQNYPNPFNPVTSIKFGIPKQSNVRVIIYDALGREVKVLINSQLGGGNYKIEWDAADSPSGIYFYRIITSDYSETKKMILIK